jgi:hypothetical protein
MNLRRPFLKILLASAGALLVALPAQSGAPAQTLEREQLLKLADDYFAALVARDPQRLPFAADAKFVEQAKRLRLGEGLWKTASALPNPDFKLVVPDAVAQQVGGIVMMQADGKPVQFGFRLKLVNGRITEAEHLLAVPRETSMPNLLKLRPAITMEVPYEYADSRGRLIGIAKSYYPALDWNNGALAPLAPDCERRENGMRTAPNGGLLSGVGVPGQPPRPPSLAGMQDCASQLNSQTFQYIDRIDNVRVEIADEKLGLALGMSHFRHEMKKKEFPILGDPGRTTLTMDFDPFDLPALHIYKIWGGQIHEIEAMGFMAPYNAPTGWE